MKQQARGIRSRQAILQAALTEFSDLGYSHVTVDLICGRHNLSKGMVYHYFQGKDDLFLNCVQLVFSVLAHTLQQEMEALPDCSLEQMIEWYYTCRQRYFQGHPREFALFQAAVLSPPPHLQPMVDELRLPLKEVNRRFFVKVLESAPVSRKVSPGDALRYLEAIEGVFWKMSVAFAGTAVSDGGILQQQRLLLSMLLHGIF